MSAGLPEDSKTRVGCSRLIRVLTEWNAPDTGGTVILIYRKELFSKKRRLRRMQGIR